MVASKGLPLIYGFEGAGTNVPTADATNKWSKAHGLPLQEAAESLVVSAQCMCVSCACVRVCVCLRRVGKV
jgi:hypothetical protein